MLSFRSPLHRPVQFCDSLLSGTALNNPPNRRSIYGCHVFIGSFCKTVNAEWFRRGTHTPSLAPEVRLSFPEGLWSWLAREYVRPLALVFHLWRVRAALDDFFNPESRSLQVTFRLRRWYEEEVQ